MEALNKAPLRNAPEPVDADKPDLKGLRRKLEKQKAQPASSPTPKRPPTTANLEAPRQIIYSRAVPITHPNPGCSVPHTSRDFGPAVSLEEAIDGAVTQAPAGPGYYLVEQPATALESESQYLFRRFASLTGHPDGRAVERISRVCGEERIRPSDVLFLDLETTGLGMTPLFLVGTMECADQGFVFRQYFARDYSEEVSILSAISERLRDMRMLVTFNGKTFDLPFMRNRSIATGVSLALPNAHLDLLHEARSIYKRDLPNCRLQTLEQMVCGRSRDDDIPGSDIPAVYHEYVRTGNANKISVVLLHNLYDLLTMADLMARMWGRE